MSINSSHSSLIRLTLILAIALAGCLSLTAQSWETTTSTRNHTVLRVERASDGLFGQEWDTVEIFKEGKEVVRIINGKVVAETFPTRRDARRMFKMYSDVK